MTDQPIPPDTSAIRASVARAYDYMVFGKDHYEVDREVTHELLKVTPDMVWAARENRAYLGRVVRYLVQECGIRQFIDHGSGLPTARNVHEVAQSYAPDVRVVYVDNDPVVLAHGRALLADNDSTIVITADMGQPETILDDPEVRRLIDFTEPIGLLYISVLHCLPDEADPWRAVRHMLAAVPSGSCLAMSHLCSEDDRAAAEFTAIANAATPWGRVRRPEEIHRFFDGLTVIPPGVGNVATWRLDLGPAVLPRPRSPDDEEGDEEVWPAAWRDDVLDHLPARKLWEEGGVARC